MAWSGSGVFSRLYSWVTDRDAGIDIDSTRMDAEMDGFAAGIQACLAKNGENAATGNLPMGGFRHTGVGNGSARTDYAALGQVQMGAPNWASADTGSASAVEVDLTPAITAYAAGLAFYFIPAYTSSGVAATIAVNGLAAKSLKHRNGLTEPSIGANALYQVVYDGTLFRLMT